MNVHFNKIINVVPFSLHTHRIERPDDAKLWRRLALGPMSLHLLNLLQSQSTLSLNDGMPHDQRYLRTQPMLLL